MLKKSIGHYTLTAGLPFLGARYNGRFTEQSSNVSGAFTVWGVSGLGLLATVSSSPMSLRFQGTLARPHYAVQQRCAQRRAAM